MKNYPLKIKSNTRINEKTFLLGFDISDGGFTAVPGQFVNVKINKTNYPLLRRPFSISDLKDEELFIMFDVRGEGTKMLAQKNIGEEVDILGPLGSGFNIKDDFDLAVIIAGGIGAAPFPFLMKSLEDKKIVSFVGARNESDLITSGILNTIVSTDDGSAGFHGNVVQSLSSEFHNYEGKKIKIFACGPTPMLKGVQQFAKEKMVSCELSLESYMACGFGLCQGCPVEKKDGSGYMLVCKDGPVFNSEGIKL